MRPPQRTTLWAWVGLVSVASLVVLFVAVQQSGSAVRAGGIALGFWFPMVTTLLGTLIAACQPEDRVAWLLMGKRTVDESLQPEISAVWIRKVSVRGPE